MKTTNGILAAFFALAAAQTAQADWYGFKGNKTSPSYWDAQGNWYITGGGSWTKFTSGSGLTNVHINPNAGGKNNPGFVSGWDKTVTFQNEWKKLTTTLRFCAGSTSAPIKFAAKDGNASYGLTSSADLWVKDDTDNGYGSSYQTPAPCLEIQSGTYKFTYFRLGNKSGKTSTLVVTGGVLKTTSNYSRIGVSGGNGVFTIKAGSYDNLGSSNKNITLGQDSGSSGTLNVEGGSFTAGGYIALNYNAGAGKSTVNLTGGTLTANQLFLHNAGTSGGTVTIDGGTLKVYSSESKYTPASNTYTEFIAANDKLNVYVGDAGATFDTSGFNITIAEDLENKSGEVGTAYFTGGGTVTLTGALSYTGATIIDTGTTVVIPARDWLDSQSFGGIIVGMGNIEAGGTRDILKTTSGAFTVADLAKFTLTPAISSDVAHLELATTTSANDTIRVVAGSRNVIVVDGRVATVPTLTGDDIIVGAGALDIKTLSIPAGGKLVFDPVATPIYVWNGTEGAASLTVGEGAKIALSENYAGMTLGRIHLLTYRASTVQGLPDNLDDLFDASSIAPGATWTVTSEDVVEPSGNPYRKRLVLTVGDYENEAKEIRVLPVGDSITQGVGIESGDTQDKYPQYRSTIAARLAAQGYKPKMLGVWKRARYDASHVPVPEDWAWHSGISAERIIAGGNRGGVRDNMHVYLDIAGDVNVITFLIGTNDIGSGMLSGEDTYVAYTNLMFWAAAQRPNAKIVGATILDRNSPTHANHTKIVAFNALLRADYAAGRLPENFVLLDLFEAVPLRIPGNFLARDNLHLNWKGCAAAGEAFAGAIATSLPLSGLSGDPDPTVTDVPQTAQGAETTVPADYMAGMTHIFTIDAASATNAFESAPYTTTNTPVVLTRAVAKVGYYLELVRKGTNRRRYVWVDFDATGKLLDEIDFPWEGANMQFVAEKLHVYSNDPYVHNVAADDNSASGIVEGTWHNYSGPDALSGVPADVPADTYGWNDTMGADSAGYGCFQAHRILSDTEAEVLFAWNRWGGAQASSVDDIGIGTFTKSTTLGGNFSADYTFTANAADGAADTLTANAYQVRRFEIWAELLPIAHGKWTGLGGNGNFSDPANWEDGLVPSGNDALVFPDMSGTLVNDVAGLSPSSITFRPGAGEVTITGNALTGVVAITNNSSASHTINVPVYFAGDIQVKQEAMADTGDLAKSHITFAGGAYAAQGYAIENDNSDAVYSRCMFGDYYLDPAANNPWTVLNYGVTKRLCLADDSTLHVSYANRLTELYVGANAKVFVGDMALDGRLMYNMGAGSEVVVTNMSLSGSGDRYLSWNQGTSVPGVFKFKSVASSMTNNWFYLADGTAAAKHTIYIGEGGLRFENASGSAAYCIGRNANGNAETIRPWYSDFTIGARSTDVYGVVFNGSVEFNTTDELGTGRTITIDAITRANSSPAITVSGSGTLKVNKKAYNSNQPAVTVNDTATLAFAPGASLTTSNVTVNAGATLQVAQSGTVALGGSLTLKNGAFLGFNYTDRNAPTLDLAGKTVTFATGATTNIAVKVSTDGAWPRSGENVLTAGYDFTGIGVAFADGKPAWADDISVNKDGNIVINVKPMGTAVFLR